MRIKHFTFLFVLTAFLLGQDFNSVKIEAEQGNEYVQLILANMYQNGEGTSIDMEKAFYWYNKSSEQGDAIAQGMLAGMYYDGEGTSTDKKQAFSIGTIKVLNKGT